MSATVRALPMRIVERGRETVVVEGEAELVMDIMSVGQPGDYAGTIRVTVGTR
jgi:hypothetical protein